MTSRNAGRRKNALAIAFLAIASTFYVGLSFSAAQANDTDAVFQTDDASDLPSDSVDQAGALEEWEQAITKKIADSRYQLESPQSPPGLLLQKVNDRGHEHIFQIGLATNLAETYTHCAELQYITLHPTMTVNEKNEAWKSAFERYSLIDEQFNQLDLSDMEAGILENAAYEKLEPYEVELAFFCDVLGGEEPGQ